MSTWSDLLFLRGHVINPELARSLAAPTRPDLLLHTLGTDAEVESPERTSAADGGAAPARSFLVPRFYRELSGEGYAHGFGNRVANERSLRPRWQKGPVAPGRRQPIGPALVESACGCTGG